MKKIGRNEPCPCGSGKKFKYCHLGREEELFQNGSDFSIEKSRTITSLPEVKYGRSIEIKDSLDIKDLTGSRVGIRFIDLKRYVDLDVSGPTFSSNEAKGSGGVVVNVLKTKESDPDNIYVAISRNIGDSSLIHQTAHVLDYLGGSRLIPGISRPLSFELGIPVEHLDHPQEYGFWLEYLQKRFDVQFDADDAIIDFLFKEDMLIKGDEIRSGDEFVLKSKSDGILQFLNNKGAEIDALICELPGYIGSRVARK